MKFIFQIDEKGGWEFKKKKKKKGKEREKSFLRCRTIKSIYWLLWVFGGLDRM